MHGHKCTIQISVSCHVLTFLLLLSSLFFVVDGNDKNNYNVYVLEYKTPYTTDDYYGYTKNIMDQETDRNSLTTNVALNRKTCKYVKNNGGWNNWEFKCIASGLTEKQAKRLNKKISRDF